jgi:hypothetical protein
MGYVTDFTGEITIIPPLSWDEIRDSPWRPDAAQSQDEDLMFRIAEHAISTIEGSAAIRKAVAVASTWEEEARGYHIVECLQRIADAYPDRQFVGHISAEGEEAGDMWRLAVVNGRAVKIKPTIVWPGDETVQDAEVKDLVEYVRDVLATSANDWSADPAGAVLYGIFHGWSGDPDDPDSADCYNLIGERFGWTPARMENVKRLHRIVDKYTRQDEEN